MILKRYRRNFAATLGLLAAIAIGRPLLATPPGKPIRSGLWVTQKLPLTQRDAEELESQLRENHNLSGVCLHIPWDEIEKASGQPNFEAIDKTVAIFRRNGVKYQLCFKPGAFTPAFVFSDGAKAFETEVRNSHRADFGSRVRIPVPWDPTYESDFSRTIERLGDRYASDPLCVSVVLTCANFMSAEMHLPKDRSEIARWHALGDYGSELLEVYKKFTDLWASAFPKQEISLHISKVLDLPPSFQERIIDYGLSRYPERFSIQSCQLTGRKEDTGVMTYDLVQEYRERVHHGFQSLAGLNGHDGRMGSPEMAALNLVHAKAEYWELWHGDGFSVRTSAEAAKAWQEAKDLGYDAYKKKLMADGKYR
ncbi:MAG TPA: beta-galactosidase [Chthoniobacterales bacterium]|jgi:hypothetical protein